MKCYPLHLMNWKDIEEIFKENKIILIPMGSMEQHGSHSINGDFLAATKIAEIISEELELPYLPTLPFGNSSYFLEYPGTISLREETISAVIKDVLNSLLKHNQYKIVFVNGHAGNNSAINTSVRDLRKDYENLNVITVNLWQSLSVDQKNELYSEQHDPSGHGAEPLSSIMRFLYPDYIDDFKDNYKATKKTLNDIKVVNLNDAIHNDINFKVYFDMDDISNSGRYSQSFTPSKERGEKILEVISKNIIEIIKKYYGGN